MLRACRRVLKPGGRIAFYNIFVVHGVPDAERRRAARARNPFVYTRAEQQSLLRSAGFQQVREKDVTAEFLRVSRALYEANARHARALRRVQGTAALEQDQAARESAIAGIEAGLLRRSLFSARRP